MNYFQTEQDVFVLPVCRQMLVEVQSYSTSPIILACPPKWNIIYTQEKKKKKKKSVHSQNDAACVM